MPNEDFAGWAAEQLLHELRAGAVPRVPASAFVWEPMLTELRRRLGDDDRSLALDLLGDPERVMFGGLVSRGLPEDLEITRALVEVFERETDDERAIGLFHQIAARPTDLEVRTRLADWLEEHAAEFIDEQRRFFGGVDASDLLRGRLSSDAFATKRWVYLYSCHALADLDEARCLIELHLQDPDPIVALAAKRSLARLDPDAGTDDG